MNIRLAKPEEAPQIAKIHYYEINQGFLRQLGLRFLSLLYLAMIKSPLAFVVVAEENNEIIGFISGCTNVNGFYKDFFKKYTFKATLILLSNIFKISTIKKIFEILKYPKKEKKEIPDAELLTMAIKKEFQGQGIGQKLFEEFVLEMKNRRIRQFKVIVGESLAQAIQFYEKVGFKFHSQMTIHQNNLSRVYIYTIK